MGLRLKEALKQRVEVTPHKREEKLNIKLHSLYFNFPAGILTKMKILKNIIISSDGSYYFFNSGEILLSNKLVTFKKQDEKNSSFNQKKKKAVVDSKQSSY